MSTPDYYLPVMPYLIVSNGNEFLTFLKIVFNAEERLIVPRENGSIMHGEISIGKATIMFAEANEIHTSFPAGMFIMIENLDEVYHLALANGAQSIQEIAERDYGKSAGVQDHFGNKWWLTEQYLE